MRVLVATRRLGPPSSRRVARALLEALVPLAREQVRRLGPLYEAGVRYSTEPEESFVDPATVDARKAGDCAHLSLWRVAELRNSGENAQFLIDLMGERRARGGVRRTYHVTVLRADGTREDPSARLGMPT